MNTKGIWLSLILAPVLAVGQVVDQQNTSFGTNAFMLETTEFLGQSFRPSINGHLTGVDLMLARNPARSGIINLQIRSLTTVGTDLVPADLGPVLFSNDYSFDVVGAGFSLVHFPITSQPFLASDQPYAILLTTSAPPGNGGIDPVAWQHSLVPYSRGAGYMERSGLPIPSPGWKTLGDIDFAFQTIMVVPEPSTLSLALGGVILWGAATLRRHRSD